MKIIICGAGQVGSGIAERLAAEGNDVSIIDQSAELVQRVNDLLDVRAFHGHGAHPDVLEKAGARDADMLIAVTLHDEVNMMACHVGHALFDVPTKIARVRAQSYLDKAWATLFARENVAIDQVISPEIEVGNVVMRRLAMPGAFDIGYFADGKVALVGMSCQAECPVIDTPLKQLSELFPDLPSVVVAISRQGRLIAPHGDDQLLVGDEAYVVSPIGQVPRLLKIFGQEQGLARRIIIAGGGNIGLFVARSIEENHPDIRVRLIESSKTRAVEIASTVPRTTVLNGSAVNDDVLREADVSNADMIIALTNDDQVNILTAVLAKQLGCKRALSLVNHSGYASLVRSFNIDAHVNPKAITVSRILQQVRRGRIRAIHTIQNGAGEVIEAEVLSASPVVGKTIKELRLPDGVRFGSILREGKLIRPTSATPLDTHDRVILFATSQRVRDIEHLFRVSIEYLG